MPSDQRPPFPTYLLPAFSFPFRRRQTSTSSIPTVASIPPLSYSPTSSASTTPSSSPPSSEFLTADNFSAVELLHKVQDRDALIFQNHTEAAGGISRVQPNTLKCVICATDVAFASQIVSKGFTGRHGRAYLVAPPSPASSEASSKTTELINTRIGKSVHRELLTGAHVVADVSCDICQTILGWKYVDAKDLGQRYKIGKYILETKRVVGFSSWEDAAEKLDGERDEVDTMVGEVGFDSEDEDECEDLFAGIWDKEIVRKRRTRKVATMTKEDNTL